MLRSRVALGSGDLREAVTCVASASAIAAASGKPALRAQAAYAAALTHLAVGDQEAVSGDLSACLGAARAAYDPLLAVRARLIAAESERRLGKRASGARLVRRLRRMGAGRVPPIVSARVDLLADLLKDERPGVTRRHVDSSGLGGLSLFGPPERPPTRPAALDDLIALFQCCQTADEPPAILNALATRLRAILRATAVSCARIAVRTCARLDCNVTPGSGC